MKIQEMDFIDDFFYESNRIFFVVFNLTNSMRIFLLLRTLSNYASLWTNSSFWSV